MLTEEEIEELEREKFETKLKCKEIYQTILTLRNILKSYQKYHLRYLKRYENADRKLFEEKVKICKTRKRKNSKEKPLEINLSKKQLLKIAEVLNIDLFNSKE